MVWPCSSTGSGSGSLGTMSSTAMHSSAAAGVVIPGATTTSAPPTTRGGESAGQESTHEFSRLEVVGGHRAASTESSTPGWNSSVQTSGTTTSSTPPYPSRCWASPING